MGAFLSHPILIPTYRAISFVGGELQLLVAVLGGHAQPGTFVCVLLSLGDVFVPVVRVILFVPHLIGMHRVHLPLFPNLTGFH